MKVCSKCLLEKDESDFYFHSKKTGKLRPACKVCTLLSNSKWVKENLDAHKQLCKNWRLSNPDKERENRYQWMLSNRDRRNAWAREWAKTRRYVFTAKAAKRRSLKLQQTPDLTDEQKEQVNYLYWLAKDLRAVSGEEYHVDHIHPLSKGGLHEPSNLQILPKDLNLRKSDKVDF
jgi:5-methylcytosine-specific restriction endonuclease McrA